MEYFIGSKCPKCGSDELLDMGRTYIDYSHEVYCKSCKWIGSSYELKIKKEGD